MATQTATSFDAFLKNAYRGTIVELLNQETYLVEKVEGRNVNDLGTFTGRQLVFAVHTARNRGRGALTDGGTLPTAGTQAGLDGIVTIKTLSQAIELTDQVIQQSKTNEGAFTKAMSFEMEGATQDLRKDACRVGYGTGDGLLASCTSTQSTVNTFAVDTGQYISVGDGVDVIVKADGTTGTGAVGRTVTAVAYTGTAGTSSQANANITIGGAAISVDNTFGVYISGDRSNESDGLQNIYSTGRTLHQINSSTNTIWDSNVTAAGWVNANEDLFMKQAQIIRQRSGKNVTGFLTTLGVQRRLAANYVSQKRWNDDRATRIDGGYEAIMVSAGGKATAVVSDVDAPNGVAFSLNDDSLCWAEIKRPDWLEAPDARGSIFQQKDGSTAGSKLAVWQAYIVWYATLVNIAPHRGGKITQLNDDKPVARV